MSTCKFKAYPSFIRLINGKENCYGEYSQSMLTFSGVKGEFESCQILLCQEHNAKDIKVELSSLVNDGGFKINHSSIEVYFQHYFENLQRAPDSQLFDVGFYPDALIPIKYAKIYASLFNQKVKALWFTVKIPANAREGLYQANFKIIIDGQIIIVPVQVKVYDFKLPKLSTMPTSFGIWTNQDDKNYDKKFFESYQDFFLNYRLNTFWHIKKDVGASDFTAAVKKYFDHPMFVCYGLPDFRGKPLEFQFEKYKEYIKELAKSSSTKKDLLSKAYTYFYDEPEAFQGIEPSERAVLRYKQILNEVFFEIESDLTGDYDEFKKIKNYKSRIINLKCLGTILNTCPSTILKENTSIWCPGFAQFKEPRIYNDAFNQTKALGADMWWYGCMCPVYPSPTYQINDRLISSRLVSWMQYSLDIIGNLFWSAAAYDDSQIFANPQIKSYPSGDGFLCYPGDKFNQAAPLPSIRLMSIRDGMEEFELLKALEEKYAKIGKQYRNFCAKKAVKTFIQSMFENILMTNGERQFEKYRQRLMTKLSEKNPCGLIIEEVSISGNVAQITLYAKKRTSVTINGEKIAANDCKYSLKLKLKNQENYIDIVAENNGVKYEIKEFISNRWQVMHSLDNAQISKLFELQNHSQIKNILYPTGMGLPTEKGVEFLLKIDSLTNRAHIKVPLKEIKGSAYKFSFRLFNAESRSLTVYVYAQNGKEKFQAEAGELFGGGTVFMNFEFLEISKHFKDIEFMSIEIRNTYDTDKQTDMRVVFNDFNAYYQ